MLAFRASPADAQPGPTPDRPRHPILTSILPALDTAFGLESPDLFPEEIAGLVASLAAVLDAETQADFVFLEAA